MSKKKPKIKKVTNKKCPHSSSCFECPLSDCHMDRGITNINMLPGDFEAHIGGTDVERLQDKLMK